MRAPSTEELLVRVRQAHTGAAPVSELVPLLETATSSIQQTWQTFLLESTEDVEMPVQVREKIAGALEEYLDCLKRLQEAAAASDLPALGSGVEEAEKCVAAIRAAQDEHRAVLATGPTMFPYLNRMLIQYEHVRQGGDSQRLQAVLNEGASFVHWLRREVNVRSTSPEDVQMVFHLRQFLEALKAAVEEQESLPDVHEDIVDLSTHLAGLLAQEPLERPEEGPTAVPAVNQVLQALGSCSGEAGEFDFLLSLLAQCRTALQTLTPLTSPPPLLTALGSVLSCLDRMEESLLEGNDFDELVAAATDLERTANLLAQLHGTLDQTPEYASETEGLPPFLRSVLDPGYRLLAGNGDADTVFEAADHLETMAAEMQRETARVEEADPRLQSIQEALECMREAAEMLRELATSGHPKSLDLATGLCAQAAEFMGDPRSK